MSEPLVGTCIPLGEPIAATVRPMRVRWLVAIALVASLSACGDPESSRSVTEKSAAKEPYSGDLAGKRGAEQALECEGESYRHGTGDPDDGLEEIGDSPGLGLDHWMDPEAFFNQVPTSGYSLEREDDDGRALLSFDADGRTVIAFVMHDGVTDYQDDEGWGVESYAMCDPAEWPPQVTDELDIGVWTDESGARVSVQKIMSFHGSAHCDWKDTTWIWLGKDGKEGEFLGNPHRDLRDMLRSTYELDVPVPADARDTGWSRGTERLLIAADGSAVYLVPTNQGADQSVGDRWPAAKEPIRCA